jgi:hypothetical protein
MANENGIIALCWNNIYETENNSFIPQEHLRKLHNGFHISLARNTLIYNHLEFILSFLINIPINIVLLKGLALEKMVYENKGLRQMNDLDILVSQEKALLLRTILLKNGFESVPLVSRFHEKVMPSWGKHLPEMYFRGLSLEIHIKLFDQEDNSITKDFLDKAVAGKQNNYEVFLPDPQLFFLYLINHLENHESHGTSQLRLYADLIILISVFKDKIFNQNLIEHSRSANIEKALYDKLTILKIFWKIVFPGWIDEKINQTNKEKVIERFLQFLRYPGENPVEEKQKSVFKLLKEVPGIHNRFLLILGFLFPSLTFMKYKYKTKTKATALLYYPVRWKDIIVKELRRSGS